MGQRKIAGISKKYYRTFCSKSKSLRKLFNNVKKAIEQVMRKMNVLLKSCICFQVHDSWENNHVKNENVEYVDRVAKKVNLLHVSIVVIIVELVVIFIMRFMKQ